MNCQLALDKICTVASSKGLATALAAALGQLGGKFTASTVNLGVDYCAGASVRASGRSSKLKSRVALLCRKARRLK
eukprot:2729893-Pyramimonas_sp.AAC.1